jgi:hypothetical protein
MDAGEDKIAAILRRLIGRPRDKTARIHCPDEETLAIYLSGNVKGGEAQQVEAHLSKCSLCVEDMVAAYKSGAEHEIARVPQRLIEKAMGLVEEKKTLFDLVVQLVKGSIDIIQTSGRVMPVAVPMVRGATKPAQGNIVQVEKEVGRFRVAVELELIESGTCQVVANVTEEEGKPAEGIRLSLSSEGREQASFLTRDGKVLFDRITPGEYSIAVSESGTPVGRIKLSLML